MSKIINHPTPEQIMEFASLPLMSFDRSDFAEYLAFSAHFASCEKCRNLKNHMVSFVEKYSELLLGADEDDTARRLQAFLDSENKSATISKECASFDVCKRRKTVPGEQRCAIEDVSDTIMRGTGFESERTPNLEFLEFMTDDEV